MTDKIKVAIIGLDTSHSVELPKLMIDPAVPEQNQIHDLLPTRCLRFDTPFQLKEGLDKRQAYLESIGVMVTEDFDVAVGDCDAILIEINDPSRHLEYFEKCAKLGKPIFLDKPFADTVENMNKIIEIANANHIRFFTASSLRFDVDFVAGQQADKVPYSTTVWGPLGQAAAGSSYVWYGVHAFEMLERCMGTGATTVRTVVDEKGAVCVVGYADGRRGVVELATGDWHYSARMTYGKEPAVDIHVTGRVPYYVMLLKEIVRFLKGESVGVPLEESKEIMALLEAADESANSGKVALVKK